MNDGETVLSGPSPGAGGPPAAADIDEKVFAEAVRRGLITPSQGTAAREEARTKGVPLLEALLRRGLVSEEAARELDEETKEDFVPGYRVIAKLGEGGMGVVYKALQKRLDREVALKVVMPRLAADPAYLKRFEREAKAVGKLNHPGIVAAYDYGESNGRVFLAMEFVDGVNLADCIRRDGPMEEGRALALVRDVASGLAHAQAAGIIHRDIKPANILLANRRPGDADPGTSSGAKVTDLGLARSAGQAGATELTAAGAILGTPGYMAPEQAFGREVDHRADIYALGATLYQIVTGLRPFEATTPVAVIARQQSERLADARDSRPALSPGLAALLQGMLSRESATRYPGYRELLADIDRVRSGLLPEHPLPPPHHRSVADPAALTATPATLALPPRPSTVAPAPSLASAPAATAAPALAPAPVGPKRGTAIAVGLVFLAVSGVIAVLATGGGGGGKGTESGVAPPKPSPSGPASPDRAPAVEEIAALRDKGEYGPALEAARAAKKAAGRADTPGLDALLRSLELIGDRGAEERAALKEAREARDRDDPFAMLAALEGFDRKYDFSPDLDTVKRLRTWAEAEAPEVKVASEPAGALLLVDGKEVGRTPRSFRSRVGKGLEAELRLDGFEPETTTLWVKRDEPPVFSISLRPSAPPDPEPAVTLVPAGEGRPLWTGAGLGAWSGTGGEWTLSDPERKAMLEGEEKPEPAAVLRGKSAGLGTARLDLANFVKGADGWRLQWQMIGEGRTSGNTARVEMQFAVRESGSSLVLGIDDQNAYLGTRDGASGELVRTHRWKDIPANQPHTFAVEFHGDVFVAFVDGKRAGAVAAPKDLAADRRIRAAVEGGTGYFSDIEVARMRRP